MLRFPEPRFWPRALRRRRLALVSALVPAVAISAALALLLPPRYVATARILVETPQLPASMAAPVVTEDAAARLARLEQRLTAGDILLGIAARHGRFAGQPGLDRSERIERMREATGIEQIETAPGRHGRGVAAFTVSHEAPDPALAAAVANAVVAMLIEANRDDRRARATGASDFFDGELDRLGRDLAGVEQEIADYKRAHRLALPGALARRDGALAETERRVEARAAERRLLEAERQQVERARAGRGSEPADGPLAAGARRLAREAARLDRALALIEAADAPDRTRLRELRTAIAGAPEVEMTLARLERRRRALEARQTLALTRQTEARIAERIEANRQSERFEVVERALPPERRAGPPRGLILLAGGLGGALLAFGAVLLAEARDATVRCAADLDRLAGLSAIVAVPAVLTASERRRRGRRRLLALAAAAVLLPLVFGAAQRLPLAHWAGIAAAAAGLQPATVPAGERGGQS